MKKSITSYQVPFQQGIPTYFSSILVETLCYHIPSIKNGDAAHAAVHTDAAHAARAAVHRDAVHAAVHTVTVTLHHSRAAAFANSNYTYNDRYICNIYIQ